MWCVCVLPPPNHITSISTTVAWLGCPHLFHCICSRCSHSLATAKCFCVDEIPNACRSDALPRFAVPALGTLRNTNTMEDFKSYVKGLASCPPPNYVKGLASCPLALLPSC